MPHYKTLLKALTVPFALLLTGALNLPDEDFSHWIMGKMNSYHNVFPQEKAYLHLDKPYYLSGDTLWFKGYLTEASLHHADSASQVLYVDLLEQRTGKSIALKRVKITGGIGHGDIILSNLLPKGAYTIRAYTGWMRNFSEDFFFHKDIYVFNNEATEAPKPSSSLDIRLFPEGGQLVSGLNTRIAFKALDGSGMAVEANGYVINGNKDTVAALRTEHLGMGRFFFEPRINENYEVFVRRNGTTAYSRFEFPAIKATGYAMNVNNVSFPGKVRILVYANSADQVGREVNVVAHTRGIVTVAAKGKITNKGLLINFPMTDMPEGIAHITLFDDQRNPICERLIYVDHGHRLRVKITPDKQIYGPREKTEVEVMVTDTSGKPVEASLSVAVTDAGQITDQPYAESLVSYLLLSSDLKGYIEQPASYFDPGTEDRKNKLDLLMMTQGWSRFKWEDVLKENQTPPARFTEQGFTLQGEVKRSGKKPVDKLMLSVYFSSDSINTFMTTETSESGHYEMNNLIFNDSLKVRLQGLNPKGSNGLNISIAPFDPPRFTVSRVPFYPVTVDALQLSAYLKRAGEYQDIERKIRQSRERLLKEVVIKGKKEEEHDTRKLYSWADATIKVTPLMAAGAQTIFDVIRSRVAGVNITGSGMDVTVQIRGSANLNGIIEPLFVLDGVPVDKQALYAIPVSNIESVDVLKGASAAIYGGRGGGGVISVLTKRGNSDYDYSQDITPGVLIAKIPGFDTPREFYVPPYNLSRPENFRPDYRSVVYWNPTLKTGKDGKIRFRYFNTDAATKVSIRLEALTADGFPGSAGTVYSVR